jgi:uncharacterized RDD family membrane protein YckC
MPNWDRLIQAMDRILDDTTSPSAVVAEPHELEPASDVKVIRTETGRIIDPVAVPAPTEHLMDIPVAAPPRIEAEEQRQPKDVPASDDRPAVSGAHEAEPSPNALDREPSTNRRKWTDTAPRPWRRFFARHADYLINAFLSSALFYIVASAIDDDSVAQELFDSFDRITDNAALAFLICITVTTPINGLLIGLSGGTLGKWLFGVCVLQPDGKKIGIARAFYREFLVVLKGLGLGIPIVSLVTGINAYNRLKKFGSTSWDAQIAATVVSRPRGLRQNILSGVTVVVLAGLVLAGVASGPGNTQLAECTRAYNQKNFDSAMQLCRKAADQGLPDAQILVGEMYHDGKGVAKDEAQALAWYRKAADQGNAVGQNQVGILYLTGSGVKQDDAQAMNWFRKAADNNSAVAQQNVAYMFENGRGVPKDMAQARLWYQRAAASGSKDAEKWLADHRP